MITQVQQLLLNMADTLDTIREDYTDETTTDCINTMSSKLDNLSDDLIDKEAEF